MPRGRLSIKNIVAGITSAVQMRPTSLQPPVAPPEPCSLRTCYRPSLPITCACPIVIIQGPSRLRNRPPPMGDTRLILTVGAGAPEKDTPKGEGSTNASPLRRLAKKRPLTSRLGPIGHEPLPCAGPLIRPRIVLTRRPPRWSSDAPPLAS